MIGAVIVSLLAGVTIVVSRSINARLASETSPTVSTFYNYIVGLSLSALILLVVLCIGEFNNSIQPLPFWAYLGGVLGVMVVLLSNIGVTKISSLYMTLLSFIGQVFTGVFLDFLLTRAFSWGSLIGGVVIAIGLTINLSFDRKDNKQA